jgi:lipopolysaccharide transport system permease protein
VAPGGPSSPPKGAPPLLTQARKAAARNLDRRQCRLYVRAVSETVYSAEPELRRPGAFLRRAAADARRSAAPACALFLANLRGQHRRAWLGYVWLVLPAAMTAALCAFVQSRRIVAVGATDLPYPMFVLAGMVLWQSFLDALNAPLEQLRAAQPLVTRSDIPHEAVIGAGFLLAALNATIRAAVLGAALLVLGAPLAPAALLFPLGLASLLLLGLAAGLLAAPFGLLYDDIGRAIFLGSALLFFFTPVAYPLPRVAPFSWNPVAVLMDSARGWLTGAPARPGAIAVAAVSAFALVAAWLFYRLARPHVVARLG